MTVEQAQLANELVTALGEGLKAQQELIAGMKSSLEAYSEFLTNQIKELQKDV